MTTFKRMAGTLHCEKVSLTGLAEKFGTPLYVYSKTQIQENARTLLNAYRSYPTLVCYAVKANSNLSIIKEIGRFGFGVDIVSVGELERSLLAGVHPKKIIYSSIGKRNDEICRALEVGILSFNVESVGELKQINELAKKQNTQAQVSLRINPNIDAKTHPYIATGLYTSKFGIAESELNEVIQELKAFSWLKLIGLSMHIGSQIVSVLPYRAAAQRMTLLAAKFKKEGFPLKFIDLGGGFPIRYQSEKLPSIEHFSKAMITEVKKTGLDLIIEPGRSVVGNAGVLLTRVLALKKTPQKYFVVVDAAMNDLLRPALYSAYHTIEVVTGVVGRKRKVDVVGSICESGDSFAQARFLPDVKIGDLVVLNSVGAYGFSMASNYNSRARPAEVLVYQSNVRIIRQREALEQLWQPEQC